LKFIIITNVAFIKIGSVIEHTSKSRRPLQDSPKIDSRTIESKVTWEVGRPSFYITLLLIIRQCAFCPSVHIRFDVSCQVLFQDAPLEDLFFHAFPKQ